MQHVQHNFSKEVLKEVGQRLEKRERDGERVRERERGERQTETGKANRILRAVRLLNLFAEDKQSQLYNWQRSFVASLSVSCGRQLYNEYEILQNPRNRNKNNRATTKKKRHTKPNNEI